MLSPGPLLLEEHALLSPPLNALMQLLAALKSLLKELANLEVAL